MPHIAGGSAFFVRRIRRRFIMLPFFTLNAPNLIAEDMAAKVRSPFHALLWRGGIVVVLARCTGFIFGVVVTLAFVQQAGIGFGVSVFALVMAVFAFVGCYHILISVMSHPPNKSLEPMTVGRRSSASRVMFWCPSWLSFGC
jgi:hypothetical protein